MQPLHILALHCTLSLLVFWMIGHHYLKAGIYKYGATGILSVLLLVNAFRYLPMSLFMPGQVDESFPTHVKSVIAYGDLVSGLLAIIAFLLVKTKGKSGIAFTWLFSVVSIVDIISALTVAMTNKVYNLHLGSNYFTVVVYVPMLIVIQIYILNLLINKKSYDTIKTGR